jgi:hypothetical protein
MTHPGEGMTEESIQQAHEAFGKQVSSQVARITGELNRLDGLLKAGRVDGRVLSEFRHAVDRVRTSGWQVQVWLEGDPRALSLLLMEERIRLATRLVQQLSAEINSNGNEFLGLGLLKEAMQKLDQLL